MNRRPIISRFGRLRRPGRLPVLVRLRHPGRLPVLGAATLLLVAGGSGLFAAALSAGPAGADSTLGGFTVSGLAEAVTAQYEQPNFPLPATPSLEFDEGYASTTDNFGPSGTATASSLYPGQVVANAGPELALLVPGAPLPPAPVWPVQATSEYPQAPNTGSTDQPGVNMDATSTTNGNTASATLGDDAATAGSNGANPTQQAPSSPGNPLAGSSLIIGIGNMSATSSSQAPAASANSQASATDAGISILGGFITIGSVTSTATATSDGTTGKVTGTTQVQNMDILGQPVSVDANGITAAGQSTPAAIPLSTINGDLSQLGIAISLTNPTDTVNGPSAARTLDGLKISVDLKTLDSPLNMVAGLLPASLTSQLPVALPNDQQLTLDLATLQVSSTASPSFAAGNSGSAGSAASGSSTSTPSAVSSSDITGNSGGTPGFTGTTGTGGTFSGGTSGSTPTGSTSTSGNPTSTASTPTSSVIAPAFKGVGAALVLLGLLAAAGLAYAYKRAEDAGGVLATSCADGDPLMERFNASAADLADFGGTDT
jgi:hypothetical protein